LLKKHKQPETLAHIGFQRNKKCALRFLVFYLIQNFAVNLWSPFNHIVMPSFDVISKVDPQTVENAINVARKEIVNRYDFHG